MSPEPVAPLVASARLRHEQAVTRARDALREFEANGRPVTFAKVAAVAQVSRAWLYSQPDIRAAVDRLREVNGRSTNTPVPTNQRASAASLVRRLEAAQRRNKDLTREVVQLRQQLAAAHADLRAAHSSRRLG
jgi:hypothetical protein